MMNNDRATLPSPPDMASEVSPQPTYAPIALSMGVMFLVWGIMTHWTMSLGGGMVIGWALWNWMSQICHDWKLQDE